MSDPIKYTVISQAGQACPWCRRAEELLRGADAPFDSVSLERDDLLEQAKIAGMTTVPIIYHGDRLVGGHDELVKYVKSEE